MTIINTVMIITLSEYCYYLLSVIFTTLKRKQHRYPLMWSLPMFAWPSDGQGHLQSCDCFRQVAQNWSSHGNILVAFLLGTGGSLFQSFYRAKQDVENTQLYRRGKFQPFQVIQRLVHLQFLVCYFYVCLILLYNPAYLLVFQRQVITAFWTDVDSQTCCDCWGFNSDIDRWARWSLLQLLYLVTCIF